VNSVKKLFLRSKKSIQLLKIEYNLAIDSVQIHYANRSNRAKNIRYIVVLSSRSWNVYSMQKTFGKNSFGMEITRLRYWIDYDGTHAIS
jgi:hypothetical protein